MILIEELKGLVTKKFNEFFYVDLIDNKELGNLRFLCKSRKSIHFQNESIFVGDEVVIDKINLNQKTAIIEKVNQRRNFIDRPSVANISDAYITFSVEEPLLNLEQLNKFLITAEHLRLKVSLILTKCDLITNSKRIQLIEKFQKWGYTPKTLDINESSCYENLILELKTKQCSILMGPSGVGKTTILNKIIPNLDKATASVSRKIKRGKNTTRNVELFALSKNSYLVDSPGFNLQSVEINTKEIPNLFYEIYNQFKDQSKQCKFRDCLHINEPGCAIKKDFERYKYYKQLIHNARNYRYQIQAD